MPTVARPFPGQVFSLALLVPFIAAGYAPRVADSPRASGAACDHLPAPTGERARTNDNRTPAGTLRDGVLTLRLEIRAVSWYPEREDGCAIPVFAFAEEGKAPLIPGPLVRVPAGTVVNVSVRNRVDRTLFLDGFHMEGRGVPRVELGRDSVREFRSTAGVAGTYSYAALTNNPAGTAPGRGPSDIAGQLRGALIVDPPGARTTPEDRVFVLTRWTIPDSVSPPRSEAGLHEILTINGKSWPYTERLSYAVGDHVRWRVINGSDRPHPMHLHGFYFRVENKGRVFSDTVLGERARTVVTESLGPGETMMLSWTPERPGNWLFHCHFVQHMSAAQRIDRMPGATAPAEQHAGDSNHALQDMAGLIVGINVRTATGARAAENTRAPRRQLRLFANQRPNVFGAVSGLSFVLQEGERPPARDSLTLPGSTIILKRGEPTQITVFNRLAVPLSVHWHGIELESFYDGVGGWSGLNNRVAPTISPGDSFVVRLTPPRAGTFMYHVHGETGDELPRGLYGPLIVLEPSQSFDSETNRIILVSEKGQWSGPLLVNGSEAPTMELTRGRTYRLRLINIKSERRLVVNMTSGSDTLQWRLLARDGAELPPNTTRLESPVIDPFDPGQIRDYEFTPAKAGVLELRFRTPQFPRTAAGTPTVTLTIRVNAGS